jgi:VIT1/CCC1 family predicted Fe2+/Mn2+ transporter
MSPAPTIEPLLTAVTSSVKKISKVSDLDIKLKNTWRVNNSTYMNYTVVLRGSKTSSSSALVRLNASIMDNTFSSALSEAMGTPVTVTGAYQRNVTDSSQNDMRDPRTASKEQI